MVQKFNSEVFNSLISFYWHIKSKVETKLSKKMNKTAFFLISCKTWVIWIKLIWISGHHQNVSYHTQVKILPQDNFLLLIANVFCFFATCLYQFVSNWRLFLFFWLNLPLVLKFDLKFPKSPWTKKFVCHLFLAVSLKKPLSKTFFIP